PDATSIRARPEVSHSHWTLAAAVSPQQTGGAGRGSARCGRPVPRSRATTAVCVSTSSERPLTASPRAGLDVRKAYATSPVSAANRVRFPRLVWYQRPPLSAGVTLSCPGLVLTLAVMPVDGAKMGGAWRVIAAERA